MDKDVIVKAGEVLINILQKSVANGRLKQKEVNDYLNEIMQMRPIDGLKRVVELIYQYGGDSLSEQELKKIEILAKNTCDPSYKGGAVETVNISEISDDFFNKLRPAAAKLRDLINTKDSPEKQKQYIVCLRELSNIHVREIEKTFFFLKKLSESFLQIGVDKEYFRDKIKEWTDQIENTSSLELFKAQTAQVSHK